jgi:hypothetical protein
MLFHSNIDYRSFTAKWLTCKNKKQNPIINFLNNENKLFDF